MAKGTLSDLALGVVTAIVLLFIGLWAINQVATLDEGAFYDYSYNATSDTTTDYANATWVEKTIWVGAFHSIPGEATPLNQVIVEMVNDNTTDVLTMTTQLNGTSLGTFTVTPSTPGNNTYNTAGLTSLTNANISVSSNSSGTLDARITNVTVNYPVDRTANQFGTTQEALVTSTNTTFDVMILVIIIVALGVAIAVLRGFGGTGRVSAV